MRNHFAVAQIRQLTVGYWLDDHLPQRTRDDVEALSRLLCTLMADAVMSLALFKEAQAASLARRPSRRREEDLAYQRAVSARVDELEAADPRDFRHPDYIKWRHAVTEQATRDVTQANWARGLWPDMYCFRLPFIHAKSFLLAIAQIRKALSALTTYDLGSATRNEATRAALAEFDASVPDVARVRNSIAHREDRVRGLGPRDREMSLPPMMNRLVEAPGGGVLIEEALYNDHYGCTVEDGSYVEVDVSDATTEAARAAVQAVFDALPWLGHRHLEPAR